MQDEGQVGSRYAALAEEPTQADCDAVARMRLHPLPVFDNREAMAYIVFREFGCSRDQALRVVDEMISLAPALRTVAARKWRKPRRR
jgi:hypothetical protein